MGSLWENPWRPHQLICNFFCWRQRWMSPSVCMSTAAFAHVAQLCPQPAILSTVGRDIKSQEKEKGIHHEPILFFSFGWNLGLKSYYCERSCAPSCRPCWFNFPHTRLWRHLSNFPRIQDEESATKMKVHYPNFQSRHPLWQHRLEGDKKVETTFGDKFEQSAKTSPSSVKLKYFLVK